MPVSRAIRLAAIVGSIVGAIVVTTVLVRGAPTARVTPRATPRAAARVAPSAATPFGADRERGAPTITVANDRVARAAELHARAMSLQMAGRAREAAALHRASAALRPADDSAATTCLEHAGTLLADVGDFAGARAAMQAAAGRALARGDVARAADLTLLAGFVAREQGDAAAMMLYAREARWLADGPSVTPARRAAILGRIRFDMREPRGDAVPAQLHTQ